MAALCPRDPSPHVKPRRDATPRRLAVAAHDFAAWSVHSRALQRKRPGGFGKMGQGLLFGVGTFLLGIVFVCFGYSFWV